MFLQVGAATSTEIRYELPLQQLRLAARVLPYMFLNPTQSDESENNIPKKILVSHSCIPHPHFSSVVFSVCVMAHMETGTSCSLCV